MAVEGVDHMIRCLPTSTMGKLPPEGMANSTDISNKGKTIHKQEKVR